MKLAIVFAGLSLAAPAVFAATPAIGVAMSDGIILINDTQTPGNATVFDGAILQTRKNWSQVQLKDGAQVRLESESRGTVFRDHVDLQQGSARISDYSANANGLSVRADAQSSASVTMKGKVVEVAALTGNVHVFNANGMNVANLLPGRALDLLPQDAGASTPSTLTGCAVRQNGNVLLKDETSNVTAQLRGGNVRAGQRVQVTGSLVPNATPAAGATQVIQVTNVKAVGGSCNAGGAAAAGAGAAGAGAAGAGAAAGATIGVSTAAIAGAGVAAATGIGLGAAAATGNLGGGAPGSTSPQPPSL
jgi:hypothetical protein